MKHKTCVQGASRKENDFRYLKLLIRILYTKTFLTLSDKCDTFHIMIYKYNI